MPRPYDKETEDKLKRIHRKQYEMGIRHAQERVKTEMMLHEYRAYAGERELKKAVEIEKKKQSRSQPESWVSRLKKAVRKHFSKGK